MRQFIFFLLLIVHGSSKAQLSTDHKIKVILLGTFHFGATSDQNKTVFPDLFSVKRQQELEKLTNELAALTPTQIMVENESSQQKKWDSILVYTKPDDTTIRNEIYQIGIRTARKALLSNVTCVDFQEELPYDSITAYDKKYPEDSVSTYPVFNIKIKNTFKKVELKNVSLIEYYQYLNSAFYLKNAMLDYVHYVLAYGKGIDYTGVLFTTAWYDRNIKIFTNILRSIKPDDKTIIVIFGSSHIPVLRQLFENHPLFEIVDIDKVLR